MVVWGEYLPHQDDTEVDDQSLTIADREGITGRGTGIFFLRGGGGRKGGGGGGGGGGGF